MALAARDAGYEYLAITDHSASFGFGDEVSPERLREQIERIRVGPRSTGSSCWPAREVNILPDGIARLRRRAARRARLGDRQRPLLVPDAVGGDDRPDRARDRASAGRRDRPPVGAQDRAPRSVRVRRRARDRGRRRGPGTMLEINASPDRRDLNEVARARRRGRRRADRDQLRRPPRRRVRGRALRDRHRPARVADRRRRREHEAVGRGGGDAKRSRPRRDPGAPGASSAHAISLTALASPSRLGSGFTASEPQADPTRARGREADRHVRAGVSRRAHRAAAGRSDQDPRTPSSSAPRRTRRRGSRQPRWIATNQASPARHRSVAIRSSAASRGCDWSSRSGASPRRSGSPSSRRRTARTARAA